MKLKEVKMVAALKNGTVIDHIPSDKLFMVVSILHLEKLPNQITIGNNLASKKLGSKGIIKVSDQFFTEQDINKIALIAPDAQLNIIRDYEVKEKKKLAIPDLIEDIVRCGNPNCVTNHQPINTRFELVDRNPLTLRCHYCERMMVGDEIKIK
jgi:aspartate carbamoyltransferase regulatory subunit